MLNDMQKETRRIRRTTFVISLMKYGTALACVYLLTSCADRAVDTIAYAYLKAYTTCPGPLEAGDYHTPEEADHDQENR